ncbi:MAG: PP2C family protein-serine/threonine phosphatase, partial [Phycisphaerales bacterium]
ALPQSASEKPTGFGIFADGESWQERMAQVTATLREMSAQSDPQAMVQAYGSKMRTLFDSDHFVSFSRRNVPAGRFRITRSSRFAEELDPWKNQHRLPVLQGGLLGELIYGEEPRIANDFSPDPGDPAFEHLAGLRSYAAIPHYDQGKSINMVLVGSTEPGAYDPERFPEMVLLSGLFGRATHNLALMRDLREVNGQLEKELQTVARIQRSLLPAAAPVRADLEIATHYQASTNASGDMYDFFELPGNRLGILIADVSGHGSPAAVVMAVVHALAHSLPGEAEPAARVLAELNTTLTSRYTSDGSMFVTAFYGIFDPARRTLTYSSAGHNPPLLLDGETGATGRLQNAQGLPLGIDPGCVYEQSVAPLDAGDALVFYTDGITEARGPAVGRSVPMYGEGRLEEVVRRCATGLNHLDAEGIMRAVLEDLSGFTQGVPASDDRTMVVVKVRGR